MDCMNSQCTFAGSDDEIDRVLAADIYFVYKNYLFYHTTFGLIRIMLTSVLFFASFIASFQFN